jgi:hypothetical protein
LNTSLDREDSSRPEDSYVFFKDGLLETCIKGNFIMTKRNKRSDNTKTNIKIIGKMYLAFFDGFSMIQP